MELQDRVTVTLTEYGAKKLNECNKNFNDRCPKIKPFKTDYKEGDLFTSELHDIINNFEGHFHDGYNVCFKNIMPAENKSTQSENIKKAGNGRCGVSAKEGTFKFNGFLFAIDTLENFSCPIISTDHVVVKLDKREEFVSMTVYEMLSNAFNAAMDEIVTLRAKLKRIQEVIEE